MKILSFIIPAYNSEPFLDKCILSMLNNDVLDKIEIIIVNDGSTDKTEEVASKYCEKYPEVVRLISQENKGHGGALNTGCEQAKGRYFKVIDADDWVLTENLLSFVEYLENCNSDIVLTHHYTIDISNGDIKKWMSYPESVNKEYTFSEIVANYDDFERSMTFHGITYNTDFYHKSNYKLLEKVFYEDHEYATFPCCFAETVTPLDMFIYNYRIGDVSQSVSQNNQIKRIGHYEAVFKKMASEYKRNSLSFDSVSGKYVSLKLKTVILSYLSTVLFIEKDKKRGNLLAKEITNYCKQELPTVYKMIQKKYLVFRFLSYLHLDKSALDKIFKSKLYLKLKGSKEF